MKSVHRILLLAFLGIFLGSCGSQQVDSLEAKKARLKNLKSELVNINSEIANLEAEIQAQDPEASRQARIIPVKVQALEPQTFRHYVKVQGQVEANKNIIVSPKTAGVIQQILVREGTQVRAGQRLAQIDNAIIQRNIDEITTQLSLAKTMFEKQKNLWEKEIGTEVQYLTAQNQMELLDKRLKTLEEQAAQAAVTAPISGAIDEVFPKIGETISPGMPFFRIVNTSDLSLNVGLSEAYIPYVKRGAEVSIYFPALDDTLKTRISSVGQSIDPNGRTFAVEAKLPANPQYKANMFGEISIRDRESKDAMVLPLNILQRSESGAFVYVAEKNAEGQTLARRKDVETGLSYNDEIEILEGLQPGDQVITVGYKNLSDGAEVVISD